VNAPTFAPQSSAHSWLPAAAAALPSPVSAPSASALRMAWSANGNPAPTLFLSQISSDPAFGGAAANSKLVNCTVTGNYGGYGGGGSGTVLEQGKRQTMTGVQVTLGNASQALRNIVRARERGVEIDSNGQVTAAVCSNLPKAMKQLDRFLPDLDGCDEVAHSMLREQDEMQMRADAQRMRTRAAWSKEAAVQTQRILCDR
jgi:hypothetical protein